MSRLANSEIQKLKKYRKNKMNDTSFNPFNYPYPGQNWDTALPVEPKEPEVLTITPKPAPVLYDKHGFELKEGQQVAFMYDYKIEIGKIHKLPGPQTQLPKIYHYGDMDQYAGKHRPRSGAMAIHLQDIKSSNQYFIVAPDPEPITIKKIKCAGMIKLGQEQSATIVVLGEELFAHCL